jgi:glycosyltransferase involved in cell wall biosynthesis
VRVHIHTDSAFFSGAENMIATLLADPHFVDELDVSFSYRTSPAFDAGLAERVGDGALLVPLELLDVPAATEALPESQRGRARALAYLSGAKYRFVRENTRRIAAVLGDIRPDVVHINSGGYPGAYSTLAAALAAREVGIGHVVYVANNIAMGYSWRRALDRGLDRSVVSAVETFVTGSAFAGRVLADVLHLPPEKLRTIPNGIREREITETPDAVRMRIGAPEDRPLVAVVANLEHRKGHAVLFDALARLKASGATPLPWVAVEGTGPEGAVLRADVAARGLSDDVAFLGREAHVFDLMNAADIVALPSIANEDFPNVVLEAMSLSKPVVASIVAGTPEQIVDGETGVLVPAGNAAALASALESLAADVPRRAAMGAAGRARFEAHFTAGQAVSAYRALYEELVSRGERPSHAASR